MTFTKENGHEICYVECKKSVQGRFAHDSCERTIKIQVRFSGVQEVKGTGVAPNQQVNIHFSVERGMRLMNWVQVFLCIRESYQQ
jgi:hypothetical protein